MSDIFWLEITNACGPIGFILSALSNTILLILIFKKSSPSIGSYKYLLVLFCLFTMFYSFIELQLQPLIHLYDDTLFFIYHKQFDVSPMICRIIATSYCWCYAMSFNLFALQFVYRYIATCKPHLLNFFNGIKFLYWLLLIIAVATSWGISAIVFFPQNERTAESFLYIIRDSYGLDPEWAGYVPYKYFYNDDNNIKRFNVLSMFGLLNHALVILFSFSTLFYCGIQTYKTIQSHSGMSCKTRELQLQLFRALVVQTCIPMLFMYLPVGFLFSCPYFDLQLGAITNITTVLSQLYPGVDPLVLLFLIDGYRNTLRDLVFGKCMKPRKVAPETSVSRKVTYIAEA